MVCPESDDARLFELLRDADVLWHCLRPVDAKVIDAAPRLRLVQKIGVGVNTIDLERARSRAIAVCNMPGTNSRAVAELTLGLMLAVLRQIRRFDGDVRRGDGWSWAEARQDRLGEIGGRTIGLIGMGGIPRLLAPTLTAMGARVIYTAARAKPELPYDFVDLDALLADADIVSLHVPLTETTRQLLNAQRFARMRRGSVLINTARGALVDEAALIAALDAGTIAAAGLDVFDTEPVAPDNPLLRARRRRVDAARRVADARNTAAQPRRRGRELPSPRQRATIAAPSRLRRVNDERQKSDRHRRRPGSRSRRATRGTICEPRSARIRRRPHPRTPGSRRALDHDQRWHAQRRS